MEVREVLPRDAIPSIDDPRFAPEHFGDLADRVIVVEGDPPRAYPIRVLSYHEIVNDVVDGDPIAVTWCPICGSAIVYDRYFADGAFGLYGMRGEGEPRSWNREDLDPKTVVLGIDVRGDARGYPLPWVEAADGVVTDTVGGQDVVVFAEGGELYAYEDPGFDLSASEEGIVGDGAVWDPRSGRSDDGRQLDRLPSRRLFAFAWQDAHGADSFVTPA